jgi:membrane-bound lytic murein transglycosylase B
MLPRFSAVLFIALLLPLTAQADPRLDALEQRHPGVSAFVNEVVEEHGLDRDEVVDLLASAEYQQSIIDAITRPAEKRPWHRYAPIFLTQRRVEQGVAFWQENAELIESASEEFGVNPEVIVAIIGVETNYGANTGSYRVLDALITLGFHYPPRAGFFRRELRELLILGGEENLPVRELTGSYAGAMGLGQFIASSYRHYAVDFSGDGQRDLWGSRADAIGSVANYLGRHRWRAGELIAIEARLSEASNAKASGLSTEQSIASWQAAGVSTDVPLSAATEAGLVLLETADGGLDPWLGLHNFYVITRYNRSPLYAMAVFQLSRALDHAYHAQVNADRSD